MRTVNTTSLEIATFGAGCFWSTEKCFRKQFGGNLNLAVVGYMDDRSTTVSNEVFLDPAHYVEVLQISFDKQKVAYSDLVRFFFDMHDPTIFKNSTNVRDTQYRSTIFTHSIEQQNVAEQVRDEIQASGKLKGRIITEIQPADGWQFYIAEQKHQNYLDKKYGWLISS